MVTTGVEGVIVGVDVVGVLGVVVGVIGVVVCVNVQTNCKVYYAYGYNFTD